MHKYPFQENKNNHSVFIYSHPSPKKIRRKYSGRLLRLLRKLIGNKRRAERFRIVKNGQMKEDIIQTL